MLGAMAEAARERSGRLALISGAAGIGKSDLIESVVAGWLAADGAAVVGRGVPVVGPRLAYLPWSHALAHPLGSGAAAIDARLRGALRLLERPVDRQQALAAVAVWRELVAVADRQPLCIVLDDAQWADQSSLALIGAGLPEVVHAAILLVVAARSSALSSDSSLGEMFAEWERSEYCRHVRLGGLDTASMTELIRRAVPEANGIDEAVARAGGNPFFALTLVRSARAADASLPAQLLDFLASQLRAADPNIVRAVQVMALAGEPVDLRILSATLGAPELAVEAEVLEGTRRGLLRFDGDLVCVAHDLIAEAAVQSMGPATRRALHAGLATAYEQSDGHGHKWAAQRATHWQKAGEHEAAVVAALEGAQAAHTAAAYPEQWHHLRLAIVEYGELSATQPERLPPYDLLTEAAEAAYRAGHPTDAVELAERALAQPGESDDATTALLVRLVGYRRATGDGRGAIATARHAFETLSEDAEPLPRAEVTSAYAAVLMASGEYTAASSLARSALDLVTAQAASDRRSAVTVGALTTLGVATALKGDTDAGLAALDDALSTARTDGHKEAELRALNNRSFVLQAAGRHKAAAADALEGLVLSREQHLDLGASALLIANLVECLDWLGRWDEALAHVFEGLAQSISPEIKAGLRGTAAHITAFRGNVSQARAMIQLALDEAAGSGMAGLHAQLAAIAADIALADGAPTEALEVVTTALAALDSSDEESETLPLAVLGMLALHSLRHVEPPASFRASREYIANQVRRTVGLEGFLSTDDPAVKAWHATYEAADLTAAGTGTAVVWASASTRWADLQQSLWYARCLIWTAEFEAATSRRRAASTLSRALLVVDQLGAGTLARDVEALVRRAHLTGLSTAPPATTVDRTQPAGLTGREQQVLALLTKGETNRRIARTLFISERTASVHVSNILRKLSCRNRGEAAAAAHRLRLVSSTEEA